MESIIDHIISNEINQIEIVFLYLYIYLLHVILNLLTSNNKIIKIIKYFNLSTIKKY
jgi:hypothetical protein